MKMVFSIFFLGILSYCYSMEKIKLPPENILNDRLDDLNLEYFNEKAAVAKNLANLECTATDFLFRFDQMLENFRVFCRNNEFANYNWVGTIKKNKTKIVESILQEHPKAIKFLKDNNLISCDE